METTADRGFLVLADISGFTAFVTETELEHGSAIIGALLEAVMVGLAPPLEIQEVEGDAIFAVGADSRLAGAGALLDALDGAFAGFRERRRQLAGDESCACGACRRTAQLDLKIVAHHGRFLRHAVGGRSRVAGASVIVAHRLLKNGVGRRAGYVLLTEDAVDALGVDPAVAGLEPHTEAYEHLGAIRCFVGAPSRASLVHAGD